MAIVRLEEVIKRVQTKENKENTDRIYYVGGEHIDSENFRVTRRGLIEGSTIGPMFYYGFKAGDFLLVSRNPHLKKAGVVNFDGICSEKTFVLATADEDRLLPEFLPFVLQNDLFWDYACQHRHGSTNTFINWSTLASYEFELPDIQAQRRIANVLWTILDTIDSYKKLIAATDELVKAQFVEMFGGTQSENDRITFSLQSLIDKGWITYHLDGNHGGDYPRNDEFIEAGVPYISANCIERGRISFTNAKYVTQERAQRFRKGIAKSRDVLFAHNATVGPVALLETQEPIVILGTSLTAYRCDEKYIMPEYLKAYMENTAFICQYESDMQQTTRKQVPITTQRRYRFIIPSMNKQNQFVTFVQQADKSKFELERALTAAKAVMKGIVEEKLG